MKIVIFGLSITSSWGNGHATTFRALCQALERRGHRIVFFERDVEWYRDNRDLPHPYYCDVRTYEDWQAVLPAVRSELKDCDVGLVGSYFPDGKSALTELFASPARVRAFYDIDTPITLRGLREHGATQYLSSEHIPQLDIYFSFTGGPSLNELENKFGASLAVPLYCSVDPDKYAPRPPKEAFQCDLSYMGTYAADRQPKIEELLSVPARHLPDRKFIVAGPQYPETLEWPDNVRRIIHLEPKYHPELYSSSRLVLNVTRREMVIAGYSPSVRLFEAAACGAAMVSDNWPGLDTFFVAGREVLVPVSSDDVVRYLQEYSPAELKRIGEAARERVLAAHTSEVRAREFEQAFELACARRAASKHVVAS